MQWSASLTLVHYIVVVAGILENNKLFDYLIRGVI